jgi:hypothetical protein
MKKMPNSEKLLSLIESKKVGESVKFLRANSFRFVPHQNIDDLVFFALEYGATWWDGIEFHLDKVAYAIRRTLWSNGIFIGASVIADLIFNSLRYPKSESPIKDVLGAISEAGIHKPGIVVYPLHSFGILGGGFLRYFTGAEAGIEVPDAGLSLQAQTNDLDRTIAFLQSSAKLHCSGKRILRDQVEHYSRSRPTQWLTLNPLLAVKVRSFSGTYYENQFFLVLRLKLATTLLFMLAALEERFERSETAEFGSSKSINNFQTLDIKHYLLFEPRPGRSSFLDGRCIPMNVNRAELADLSALNIEVDPRAWRCRRPIVGKVSSSLAAVERGYLRNYVGRGSRNNQARVYRKLFDALSYFRASFRQTGNPDEQIVNLAIAFEVLLTDFYADGVLKRVGRRLRIALKSTPQKRKLCESVEALYSARSGIVHHGMADQESDLSLARAAFAHAFLGMTERLGAIPRDSNQPIAEMLGDK